MVRLEGGQGEVRGACDGPTLCLGGIYPPNNPTLSTHPQPSLPDYPPRAANAPLDRTRAPPKGGIRQTIKWGG